MTDKSQVGHGSFINSNHCSEKISYSYYGCDIETKNPIQTLCQFPNAMHANPVRSKTDGSEYRDYSYKSINRGCLVDDDAAGLRLLRLGNHNCEETILEVCSGAIVVDGAGEGECP